MPFSDRHDRARILIKEIPMDNAEKAQLLLSLAALIESGNRGTVIGSSVSLDISGPVHGTVIGEQVSVSVGPGFQGGTVIGKSVSVSVGGPEEVSLIAELREAAQLATEGKAPESWVRGLLAKAGNLGGDILKAAAVAAATNYFK